MQQLFMKSNLMLEEGLDVVALKKLDLPKKAAPDLKNWNTFYEE
jgi:CTP synthase